MCFLLFFCWILLYIRIIYTELTDLVSGLQKFTVPQRFFSHFYAVSVLWTTLLLVTTWVYAYKTSPLVSEQFQFSDLASQLTGGSHTLSFHKSQLTPLEHRFRVWCSVLLLLLMEVHSLRRLIESLYVSKYSPSARMHINGYLAGLLWVLWNPLFIVFSLHALRISCNAIAQSLFNVLFDFENLCCVWFNSHLIHCSNFHISFPVQIICCIWITIITILKASSYHQKFKQVFGNLRMTLCALIKHAKTNMRSRNRLVIKWELNQTHLEVFESNQTG